MMKLSISTLCLWAMGCLAQAAEAPKAMVPSTPMETDCDFDSAGVEKDLFLSFFPKLKAAAKTKDSAALSSLVLYPLRFNSQSRRSIKNASSLKKDFSKIFNDKVLAAIANQEAKDLFCRDQGVMLGEGEVWIQQKGKTVGISSINP